MTYDVIITICFTLSQVLHASKSECTDYYLVFESVPDTNNIINFEPVTKNTIDWIELKNQSQDAYNEIRGYGDCILELDCQDENTVCQSLYQTNHLGTQEFITSSNNYTDNPSFTYTSEPTSFNAELTTINNYLTTSTENNLASEFNNDVLNFIFKTCRLQFKSMKECLEYYVKENVTDYTNDKSIDKTTEKNVVGEFSVDIFYRNSNCTNNGSNTLNYCNEDEYNTTTLSFECEDIESDDCEEEATERTLIYETTTKLNDFNVSLKFNPKKNIQNKTNIDISNICNKSIILNNTSNEYSFKCENIDDNILEKVNETFGHVIGETETNPTKKNKTKPEDFSVILVYHNKHCTHSGHEFDVTNNCHKITNSDDANRTFSLECQFIKENCNNTNETMDIDKKMSKNNQTLFKFNTTDEWDSSGLEREEKKKYILMWFIVPGAVAAGVGLLALAMIAIKPLTALQSGSFIAPDNPNYTYPEFRDDFDEESLC